MKCHWLLSLPFLVLFLKIVEPHQNLSVNIIPDGVIVISFGFVSSSVNHVVFFDWSEKFLFVQQLPSIENEKNFFIVSKWFTEETKLIFINISKFNWQKF